MKKTATLVLAIIMVCALGITTMAAPVPTSPENPSTDRPAVTPPVKGSPEDPIVPGGPQISYGTAISDIPGFTQKGLSSLSQMEENASAEASKVLAGELALTNGQILSAGADSKVFLFDLDGQQGGRVTFSLGLQVAGQNAILLHWTGTAWEVVSSGIVDADGNFTASISAFSPYMVVTGTNTHLLDPGTPAPGGSTGVTETKATGTKATGTRSPKTGLQ